MEIWKEIPGFERYKISNHGNVINIKTLRILKLNKSSRYVSIGLQKNKKEFRRYVHRLVAFAFIENPENKPEVNHKDGNKLNNFWSNLEWCTGKENTNHSLRNGLKKSKLSFDLAEIIRKEYVPAIMSQNKLAIKYNVSAGTIKDILNNRIYKREVE